MWEYAICPLPIKRQTNQICNYAAAFIQINLRRNRVGEAYWLNSDAITNALAARKILTAKNMATIRIRQHHASNVHQRKAVFRWLFPWFSNQKIARKMFGVRFVSVFGISMWRMLRRKFRTDAHVPLGQTCMGKQNVRLLLSSITAAVVHSARAHRNRINSNCEPKM